MEKQGYIKLYRKLLDNPISYNMELLGFLSYLLLEVTHTKQEIYRGQQKIILSPGERIISQRALSERFGVSISKIHRFIKTLEDEKILEHQGSSSFTIVKLLNWDSYNGSETRTETKQKPNRNQIETKQEGKELREGKEDIYTGFKHLSMTLQEFDSLIAKGYTKEQIDEKINEIKNYSKNTKYTSLSLTVLSWLKRDSEKSTQNLIQKMQREGYSQGDMRRYIEQHHKKIHDDMKQAVEDEEIGNKTSEQIKPIVIKYRGMELELIEKYNIPTDPVLIFNLKNTVGIQ